MKNHLFKIGQKVRHIRTGEDFFIIGIKSSFYCSLSDTPKQNLLIHKDKDQPSRKGFLVRPSECEVVQS